MKSLALLIAGHSKVKFESLTPEELKGGRFYEKGILPGEEVDVLDVEGYLRFSADQDFHLAFAISLKGGCTVYLQRWLPPELPRPSYSVQAARRPWPTDAEMAFEMVWPPGA